MLLSKRKKFISSIKNLKVALSYYYNLEGNEKIALNPQTTIARDGKHMKTFSTSFWSSHQKSFLIPLCQYSIIVRIYSCEYTLTSLCEIEIQHCSDFWNCQSIRLKYPKFYFFIFRFSFSTLHCFNFADCISVE